jgi:hypothetical protein
MVLKCQLPKKSGFCHGNFDSAFQILLDLYLGMEEKEKRHKGLCLTTLSHQTVFRFLQPALERLYAFKKMCRVFIDVWNRTGPF